MRKEIVLNKLPQELVNKIAAGEVIERPSSVVKELVDNSIDAGSTKIQITIANGGIDMIEVSDNGIGIPKKNLDSVFDSHTTSKISSFEDLNNLLTMGFRGEALSTIVAVSNVRLVSKYLEEDIANEIYFKNGQKIVKSSAREKGTSVRVENIFGDIPARRKFLKSPQTEYRKILEILTPYFLIYPNIHFTVVKDGKTVVNLNGNTSLKQHSVQKERIKDVLKSEYIERMLPVFFDGSGIKVSGFVGHPSDHSKKVDQYIFVNGRSIKENGIARSVFQGMERYIPYGERIPFVLHIDIRPELVDVNVHPRKEEVRFLNPFRVYSAVEEAVKKSVTTATSFKGESREFIPTYTSQPQYTQQSKTYEPRDIFAPVSRSSSVQDSLLFSKEILTESAYMKPQIQSVQKNTLKNIFQIFNKYIVVEFNEEILWIIDQHAAAERITFEKLKKEKSLGLQKLLVPHDVEMNDLELIAMGELREFFSEFGFEYVIDNNKIFIHSVPVEFVNTNFRDFFSEVFSLTDDIEHIGKEIERLREDILATMACHGSVRSGQSLHREEMVDIYNKLIDCDNPYSCPHGRPAIWKMKLSEIDMNFERTY